MSAHRRRNRAVSSPTLTGGVGLVVGLAVGAIVAGQLHGSHVDQAVPAAARLPGAVGQPSPGGQGAADRHLATTSTPVTRTVTAVSTQTVVRTMTPAPPKPKEDTVRGKVSWTFFLGSDIATGSDRGGATCGEREGAVNIMNGTGVILTVHQGRPSVVSKKTDGTGDVTTTCQEKYSVHVAASPVYRVALTNPPNNDNATATCKTTGIRADSTSNVNASGVAQMQELGWFFGCY